MAAVPPGGAMARLTTAALIALCLTGATLLAAGVAVPLKAIIAQRLLDRAFARSLRSHHPQRPWPWADMAPVARLEVERLGIHRIVLDSGSGQAMAFGPTLLPGGAGIYQSGTAVIAAHRDTHFAFLHDLLPGDVVSAETIDGTERRYRVFGTQVVRWNGFVVPRAGKLHFLALATCYPFGGLGHSPWRYVVWLIRSDH